MCGVCVTHTRDSLCYCIAPDPWPAVTMNLRHRLQRGGFSIYRLCQQHLWNSLRHAEIRTYLRLFLKTQVSEILFAAPCTINAMIVYSPLLVSLMSNFCLVWKDGRYGFHCAGELLSFYGARDNKHLESLTGHFSPMSSNAYTLCWGLAGLANPRSVFDNLIMRLDNKLSYTRHNTMR